MEICRDGGLEAMVDHETGVLICQEKGDVYATNQPSAAFHARTSFCLDVHNEVPRVVCALLLNRSQTIELTFSLTLETCSSAEVEHDCYDFAGCAGNEI